MMEEISPDSGLESPNSKEESPDRQNLFMSDTSPLLPTSDAPAPKNAPSADDSLQVSEFPFEEAESYDNEPDETLAERLWGLTEMFPDCVVNATHTATTKTWSGVKSMYSFSRSALWIVASTSVILMAPIFFELEIAKIEEKQKSEQKQYLLGPNAAMIGPGATPPMPR